MTSLPFSNATLTYDEDGFHFRDQADRTVFTTPVQPQIVSHFEGEAITLAYAAQAVETGDSTLRFRWVREDGQATLEWNWRAEKDAIIAEPIRFSCDRAESVESIALFSIRDAAGLIQPRGAAFRRIVPGIALGPELSPIQHCFTGLNGTFSLGRGRDRTIHQQWGLPTHFFCVNHHGELGSRDCISKKTSDTLCIGLLDFPIGDVKIQLHHAHFALQFDRYEQCHYQSSPTPSSNRPLTPPLAFTIGEDSRCAIRAYYEQAVAAFHGGQVPAAGWSPQKRSNAFATQTNTWGIEVSREHKRFTSESLRGIYRELCQADDGVDMFVIDDKWESTYGHLMHCPQRLPDFEKILQEIRADGRRIGMWAAFLRCESPESVGLTTAHMLTRTDGTPFHKANEEGYYIYDVTRPEVQTVLKRLVREFAKRYRPDLIKFDFGYEIPRMDIAQPANPEFAGERFLQAALELIVGTLREELPDVVVMYYSLSPLMFGLCDQHSPDDLFMAVGDYAMEANRRFYFASICAEFGMPLYSSASYDWKSTPDIWFDALASGTLGSLADPAGDEEGERMPESLRTFYKKLKPTIGKWTRCRIETLGAQETGPITGCTATGWLRYENDKLVFAALRPNQGMLLTPPALEGFEVDVPTIFASTDGEDIRHTQHLIKVPFKKSSSDKKNQSE